MGNLDHLYRQDLPHRAVAVYIYLADRANKDNTCWPAIPTIARDLKYSESTVRRAMKDLRKAGLLETEQRYRDKGGRVHCCFGCVTRLVYNMTTNLRPSGLLVHLPLLR